MCSTDTLYMFCVIVGPVGRRGKVSTELVLGLQPSSIFLYTLPGIEENIYKYTVSF